MTLHTIRTFKSGPSLRSEHIITISTEQLLCLNDKRFWYRRTSFGIENSIFGIEHSIFDIENSIFGIEDSIFGIGKSNFGNQFNWDSDNHQYERVEMLLRHV